MTPGGGSLHFAVGPVIALVAVVTLLLLCRWVFGTGQRTPAGRPAVPRPPAAVSRPGSSSAPAAVTAPRAGTGAGAGAGTTDERPESYGLLVPVSAASDRREAERARETLLGHGVRSTVVAAPSGYEVRVFPGDAVLARALVSTA